MQVEARFHLCRLYSSCIPAQILADWERKAKSCQALLLLLHVTGTYAEQLSDTSLMDI